MFCAKCGKELPDTAKFCSKCGFKVDHQLERKHEEESRYTDRRESEQINLEKILPASQGKRFLNMIIDWVFLYLFAMVVGFILAMAAFWEALGIENWNETLLGIMMFFLFYVFFEGIWGKTPAKFITRTKVAFLDGSKPNWGTIFIRTLSRLIPFEAFSFLGSKNPIGWHDRLSSTAVVSDSEIQEKSVISIKYDKQKNNVLIIVLVIFLSIAVIGILASIVLVSLNSARNKAKLASFKATSSSAQAAAIQCDDSGGTLVTGANVAMCSNANSTTVWPTVAANTCTTETDNGNKYTVTDKTARDGVFQYQVTCNITGTVYTTTCDETSCSTIGISS